MSDRIEISERCTRDAFVYMNEKDHMDFKEIFITNEIARAKCASNSACTTVSPRTFRVFMEDEVDSLSIYIRLVHSTL